MWGPVEEFGVSLETVRRDLLTVEDRMYYRVEITNESDGCLVALSNPVWLEDAYES